MFPDNLSAQGRSEMTEYGIEAAKTAPPTAVAAWIWFGHTPEEWVSVLTVIWLMLIISLKVRDEFRKSRKGK